MNPDVPAQVPSVETFCVAVVEGAEEVLTVEAARELVAREVVAPLPEHVPKAELHPVEQ